ncbi:iron-sulfur cluster repair di-iron protein [candidate division BRC1 bacterium HGW-BRC1-1]|jgi:regulator of cell morphogenesis and NO signaling|nr:MAG: iron-sulfur cluster repair di-iron protein [candidate division BRC1 bacterium HGW-BRC1-1]
MSINLTETLNTQTTIKDLIRQRPRRAWVLEKHGVDICASQTKPLADACAQYYVVPDTLLGELRHHDAATATPDTRDWNTASLRDLIDHILEKHHAYMRRALPRISKIQAHVAPRHGHQHPVLHELLPTFQALRADLEMHTMKEEQILFPMLIAIEQGSDNRGSHCGSVANPIRMMEMEHEGADNGVARLRALTNNYQPTEDACTMHRVLFDALHELDDDIHVHIHKENDILFPRGLALEKANQSA